MDVIELSSSPTQTSLKKFIDVILNDLSPKIKNLDKRLKELTDDTTEADDEVQQHKSFFLLTNDQILKCATLMVEIFKLEIENSEVLKDTRNWVLERMKCCSEKMDIIEIELTKTLYLDESNTENGVRNVLLNASGKNFISWIDDTLKIFEIFDVLFECDTEENTDEKKKDWIEKCSKTFITFQSTIRELVSAAVIICQNCLAKDQQVINARCHVLLRESKNLLIEVLQDPFHILDTDDASKDSVLEIKENFHRPTARMFNELLKEAVYNLETSVNKAILGLVLKCLSDPLSPLDNLLKWQANNDSLKCMSDSNGDMDLIDLFDVHNEQIIQIGLFAISCSADVQRVLQLKSCLASVETLEEHLVPSLLSNNGSLHVKVLIDNWINEVSLLRNSVFLIIDPRAFIDLAVGQMRENILSLQKQDMDLETIQSVVRLGNCISDFFHAYFTWEPQVFEENVNLLQLVANLDLAKAECTAVIDLFLLNYDINSRKEYQNKDSLILKRLKLLYGLALKISNEIRDDVSSFENDPDECSSEPNQSLFNTVTIDKKNAPEKGQSKGKGILKVFDLFTVKANPPKRQKDETKRKIQNASKTRSSNKTYSRSTIIRKNFSENGRKFVHRLKEFEIPIKTASTDGLISVSRLLNASTKDFFLANISVDEGIAKASANNQSEETMNDCNNRSNFYNANKTKPKNTSLRRRVLVHRAKEAQKKIINMDLSETNLGVVSNENKERSITSLNNSLDLHVTDILEQISKLSDTISLLKIDHTIDGGQKTDSAIEKNVLRLKINENNDTSSKNVWKMRIGVEDKENRPDNTIECGIDVSFGSEVPTQERIDDLHLLEEKLAKLKAFSCKK